MTMNQLLSMARDVENERKNWRKYLRPRIRHNIETFKNNIELLAEVINDDRVLKSDQDKTMKWIKIYQISNHLLSHAYNKNIAETERFTRKWEGYIRGVPTTNACPKAAKKMMMKKIKLIDMVEGLLKAFKTVCEADKLHKKNKALKQKRLAKKNKGKKGKKMRK